ncbi:MAG: nucleotidyltransferase domain-containing protein [Pyrinomonadaceae bacterium]
MTNSSAAASAARNIAAARAEVELVFLCARTRMDQSRARAIESLASSGLDWDFVTDYAARHGLTPLVTRHLHELCPHLVPVAASSRLRQLQQRTAALNTYLAHELLVVVREFERQGISAIAWKGPSLAVSAYGRLSLRQFCDLDILLRKEDVPRAAEILRGRGYALTPALDEVQLTMMLRTQCNLAFARDERRVIVELHWDVAAKNFSAPFDREELWQRAGETPLNGGSVKTLAPEDLLLSLCVHGAKHQWERAAWVCDVAELLRAESGLDWGRLTLKARRSGSERLLWLGLSLAGKLLDAPLPPEIVREIACDPSLGRLCTIVSRRLLHEDGLRGGVSGLTGQIMFQLGARRRLRDKVRYLGFVLSPTDEDLRRVKLSRRFTPLYYLLRPLRMLATGGPRHFHH